MIGSGILFKVLSMQVVRIAIVRIAIMFMLLLI